MIELYSHYTHIYIYFIEYVRYFFYERQGIKFRKNLFSVPVYTIWKYIFVGFFPILLPNMFIYCSKNVISIEFLSRLFLNF